MATRASSENTDLVCLGPAKRGRPFSYTEAIATEICERIANGETLTSICMDDHMPTRRTVTNWLMRDHEDFVSRYARAREIQADVEAEEIRDIADNAYEDYYIDWKNNPDGSRTPFVVVDNEGVKRAALRIETRKWRAERLNRRVYGNSTRHEHEVKVRPAAGEKQIPEGLGWLAGQLRDGREPGSGSDPAGVGEE